MVVDFVEDTVEGIVAETEVVRMGLVHTAVVRIDFVVDMELDREVTVLVVALAELREDPSAVDSWACSAVAWGRLALPFRGSFVPVPFVP